MSSKKKRKRDQILKKLIRNLCFKMVCCEGAVTHIVSSCQSVHEAATWLRTSCSNQCFKWVFHRHSYVPTYMASTAMAYHILVLLQFSLRSLWNLLTNQSELHHVKFVSQVIAFAHLYEAACLSVYRSPFHSHIYMKQLASLSIAALSIHISIWSSLPLCLYLSQPFPTNDVIAETLSYTTHSTGLQQQYTNHVMEI